MVPQLAEYLQCADNAYKKEEVTLMERKVMHALSWKIAAVTPLQYIDIFCRQGLLCYAPGETLRPDLVNKLRDRVSTLAGIILRDYTFNQYRPSVIATSITAVARIMLGFEPMWTVSESCRPFASEDEVVKCAQLLVFRYKQWALNVFEKANPSVSAMKPCVSALEV